MDLVLPGDGQPAAIEVVYGDGQSGRIGEPLADSVVVEVTDSRGRPVEGVSVAFEITSGGPGADIVPKTATTDANGRTDARMALGTTIGAQTGRARVVLDGDTEGPKATFSATALSENADGIAAVSGEDQSGPAGSTLALPLVVQVTDAFGNPIAGVPVSWAAEGGGSVSAAVVNTNSQGRASVERTLGPAAGQQTTLASSEGLAGSPVTFVHTATAGNAAGLSIVSGNNQTAEVGTQLPADLVVRLTDAEGNGVPGAAVTWVVSTGGGSVTPQNGITNDAGLASASWTLGPAPGENRLDAVVSGVGIANFRATGTSGAPAALFIHTQPSSSARTGVRFERQPVIQVRDSRGNDVTTAGVVVTAQIGAGGGDLGGTRQRSTDANGRATFADLAITGAPGRRTLVFTASGYAGATSSEIDVQAIGTITTITSDTPDPSAGGAAVTVGFRVTSEGPTPTGSVTVTVADGAATCTGALSDGAGSCQLTLNRTGDRTLRATYPGGPGFEGSFDTEPHRVEAAPPQNRPPDADFNWHCEGLTCDFTDASEDDDGSIVSRHWSFGDGGTSGEENPSHTYASPGVYTVTLTVTDDDGASSVSDDEVDPEAQVLELSTQPSSSATVGQEFERQPEIQLRAGGGDLERAGVTISVVIASGGGTLGGTTTATTDGEGRAEFTNLSISGATGPHTLRFSANGFGSVTSNTIEVRKAESETKIFEPENAIVGQPVPVQFEVTGEGGTPTGTVTLTIEDGTEPGCSASVEEGSCELTFATPGDRQIGATYSGDGRFEGSSDTEDIQVDPAPPLPNSPPTAIISGANCTGLFCSFTDASTDSDGFVTNRSWNYGDGSPSDDLASHTYAATGTYPVTLTVTDDDGASDDSDPFIVVPTE